MYRMRRALLVLLAVISVLCLCGRKVSAAADEKTITLSVTYGMRQLVRTKSLFPVYIQIGNQGGNFSGTLVVKSINQDETNTAADYIRYSLLPSSYLAPNNKITSREFPVSIKSGESINKMFIDAIHDTSREYMLSVLDTRGHTVATSKVVVQNMKTQKSYTVAVVGDRYDYISLLRSFEWPYEQAYDTMGINPILIRPSQLKVENLYADMPDVLIFTDYDLESLSATQRQALAVWRAKGGILITDANIDNILQRLKQAIIESDVNKTNDRLMSGTLSMDTAYEPLSDMPVKERPNVLLLAVLILLYALLAGPLVFHALKRRKKQMHLWRMIAILSAAFTIGLILFCFRDRIIAPFLTYYEQIEQVDNTRLDAVDIGIQSPSNNDYVLHLDSSYMIIPWVSDHGTPVSEDQDTSSFGHVKIENLDGRKKVTISGYPDFTELRFTLNKMSTVKADKKISSAIRISDGKANGTVTNHTEYDLKHAVVLIPGYCIWVGDIGSGDSVSLKGAAVDNVETAFHADYFEDRGAFQNSETADHKENMWIDYLKGQNIYLASDSLLVGSVVGKETTWQKDSGYDSYGVTYYKASAGVTMGDDTHIYIPYMQQYRSDETYPYVQGWANQNYYISSSEYEATYHINDLRENDYDREITLTSILFKNVVSNQKKVVPFQGSIDIYNFERDSYDVIDWDGNEKRLTDIAPYINGSNEFSIRYRTDGVAPEEDMKFILPEIHVTGKVVSDAGN